MIECNHFELVYCVTGFALKNYFSKIGENVHMINIFILYAIAEMRCDFHVIVLCRILSSADGYSLRRQSRELHLNDFYDSASRTII